MKIAAILLLSACITASAKGISQNVTLKVKDAPMKEVFREIQKQTGLSILVDESIFQQAGKVTLDVKEMPVPEVLKLCFKNDPVHFTITEGRIVVTTTLRNETGTPVISAVPLIDVSGRVTDADSNPLVGASVKVKGSSLGTSTNSDGMFVLKGVEENATLEISFVGYETLTVAVKNQTYIDARLKVEVESLNEVVINKGYYTEKQRLSTGNVSKITSNDIQKQPVNNPLLAIQGRTPGIFITQNSGLPGSSLDVQIRGRNSVANGNLPFYIVNGVPYTSSLLKDVNNRIGDGNPFNYINPSDIESIEILKDADATAIYGSRAANGAILITTKKGRVGKTVVDINIQSGLGKVSRFMDLLNREQYLEMRREALKNDGTTPTISNAPDLLFWDTTRSTDWQKELIGRTAKWHDVQVAFSGGSTSTQFYIGGGFHKETTPFPGDFSDKKGSLHFNLTNTSLNQKLNIGLSGSFVADNNRLPATEDLTSIAMMLAPNAPPIYKADGSLNWAPISNGGLGTWQNPLAYINRQYKNLTNNLIANSLLSYKLVPELEIKTSIGYTYLHSDGYSGAPFLYFDPARWVTQGNNLRLGQYSNNTIRSWIIEPQLSYTKYLGKGTLTALIGSTIQQNNVNGSVLSGKGYNSDLVMEDIRSASSISVASSVSSVYKYNALFARVNYNWNEKYLVNLTARRDGSSRFGPESQFHNFGAASVGWIFSREKFLLKASNILSFGKLRFSYGTTGSDQVGDYSFLDLYRTTNVGIPYLGNNGLIIQGLYNPTLQWEETKKAEAGLELGFFKDRVLLTTSYFRNRSSNQLVSYGLPSTTGQTSININLPATVQNTGLEVTLNTINIRNKAISWTSNVNLTVYRNKLVSYPDLEKSSYSGLYTVGESLNITKLFRSGGVDPLTGVYQFYDSKNNIVGIPEFTTDQIVHLDRNPRWYGGFENTFSYKGLELNFLFQYVKQFGATYEIGSRAGLVNRNQPISVLDRWQKPGDISFIQKFSAGSAIAFPYALTLISDASYTDASYLRLKNLALSWQVPKRFISKVKLKNCRLFLRAQNLLTITDYEGGLDPETMNVTSLPPLRTITFGVNVKF